MVPLNSFMKDLMSLCAQNNALSLEIVQDNAIPMAAPSKLCQGESSDSDSSHKNRWGCLVIEESEPSPSAPHRVPSNLFRSSSDSDLSLSELILGSVSSSKKNKRSVPNETWRSEICSPPRPPSRKLSAASSLGQLGKPNNRRSSFPPNTSNADSLAPIARSKTDPTPMHGPRMGAKRSSSLRCALGSMAPGSSGKSSTSRTTTTSKSVEKTRPVRNWPTAAPRLIPAGCF